MCVTVFEPHVLDFGLVYLLFYVTFNDITVIYVTYGTYSRRADGLKKKVGHTVGLPCHKNFVGFFNVPAQAPIRGRPFYGYSEKPPHFSRLSRRTLEYEGPILVLHPRVPTWTCFRRVKHETEGCFITYLHVWKSNWLFTENLVSMRKT